MDTFKVSSGFSAPCIVEFWKSPRTENFHLCGHLFLSWLTNMPTYTGLSKQSPLSTWAQEVNITAQDIPNFLHILIMSIFKWLQACIYKMRQQLIWILHHNSLGKLDTIQMLLKSAHLPKDSSWIQLCTQNFKACPSFQKPVSENSQYSYFSYFQADARSFLPHVVSR